MTRKNPCPCPNLECPNHGICENCTSRHLNKGTLNYCGFYSILPSLEEAIASDPESVSSKMIKGLIAKQTAAYTALIEKHNLSQGSQAKLTMAKADFSDF